MNVTQKKLRQEQRREEEEARRLFEEPRPQPEPPRLYGPCACGEHWTRMIDKDTPGITPDCIGNGASAQ